MMHRGKRGYAGHNNKATLAAAASVFGLLLVIGVSLRSNAGVAFIAEEEEEEGANGVCSVVGAARKSREEEELFSGPLERWRGREGVSASDIAFFTSQRGIKFYYRTNARREGFSRLVWYTPPPFSSLFSECETIPPPIRSRRTKKRCRNIFGSYTYDMLFHRLDCQKRS